MDRYSTKKIENILRRILREEEEESELTSIFKEKGYSNIPEACKPSTDTSTGEVSSNIKLCFEEFQKANQQVMDIANALKGLMDEKGIQAESRRRSLNRRRF